MSVIRRIGRAACAALVFAGVALLIVIGGGRAILHLGISPVLTGSMRPAFSSGDLVVTRLVSASSLRPGDIPVLIPQGQRTAYVHRLVAVTGNPAHPIFVTRGDANAVADPWRYEVTTSRVPKVIFTVPMLGRLFAAAGTPAARALFLAGLGLAITCWAVLQILTVPPRRPSVAVHNTSS